MKTFPRLPFYVSLRFNLQNGDRKSAFNSTFLRPKTLNYRHRVKPTSVKGENEKMKRATGSPLPNPPNMGLIVLQVKKNQRSTNQLPRKSP